MSNNAIFNATCFSTNTEKFSSIAIMKQYIMSANCSNVIYLNNNIVKFDHVLEFGEKSQITHTSLFFEMLSFSKDSKVCENSDCFIIFFDLELQKSLIELNNIITFLKCYVNEKKIFIIYFYNDENKICENFEEENINEIFSSNNLNNFDSYKVDIDSPYDLNEAIDSITKDIFDSNKEPFDSKNLSQSNPGCSIF